MEVSSVIHRRESREVKPLVDSAVVADLWLPPYLVVLVAEHRQRISGGNRYSRPMANVPSSRHRRRRGSAVVLSKTTGDALSTLLSVDSAYAAARLRTRSLLARRCTVFVFSGASDVLESAWRVNRLDGPGSVIHAGTRTERSQISHGEFRAVSRRRRSCKPRLTDRKPLREGMAPSGDVVHNPQGIIST